MWTIYKIILLTEHKNTYMDWKSFCGLITFDTLAYISFINNCIIFSGLTPEVIHVVGCLYSESGNNMEELNAKRRGDLMLRNKIDFIMKLKITRHIGFGYVHKKQHHARCNKPKYSYDTYASFWNRNRFDLRRGTSTEWPDLLRGPGLFSLPC